ncbi:MAG: asparagine synthase-related protein, partial [Proteobacteria bacterium]|nr:asparagine synthase-related protein [Pseudomonadota bacterium]
RSDVLVGACLSGGLDSSSIVCMMREIQGVDQKISTFSSVFPGEKVDESNYIDELASQKNLTSYKNYPSPDAFMMNLDSLLYHQDLPFLGASIFAQWHTFKSAKEQNVTVLLDGQGA